MFEDVRTCVFPTAMEMFSGLYPYTFSSEINNTTRSLKFALFVAQIYGHFVTLLDTSPGMVASQINDKLLQQKSQSPDWASLGVVLLANRGISLAPGNQASVSVEHCALLSFRMPHRSHKLFLPLLSADFVAGILGCYENTVRKC